MNPEEIIKLQEEIPELFKKVKGLEKPLIEQQESIKKAMEQFKCIHKKRAKYKGKNVMMELLACNAVIIRFEDLGEHKNFFDSIK